MNENHLKRQVYLIAEGAEQAILDVERQITALQSDVKALTAYTDQLSADTGKENDTPYQVHEGIAVIELKGPLVARTTWMSRLLGAMSYEDLRAQIVHALSNDAVTDILIDADTPGGQVNGLGEAASLIKKASALKPISTYAGGGLLSAGYWLGSATNKIYASDTAFIGSIGVVVTHASYEGALEKAGIKVTKIKSGDKKQVGSSEKDLTAEDKAYLQAQVDDLFGLFKQHVVSNRPDVSPAAFDGAEYVADKALAMGLVDRVMTFDDVLAQIVNNRVSTNGSGNGGTFIMKQGLTAEQVAAAAASGAKLEDLELGAESTEVDAQAQEGAASQEAVLKENAVQAEEQKQEAASVQGDSPAVTAYLESQLAKANDKVTDLTVENRDLQNKLTAAESHLPKFKVIASEAINRMMVAMGKARTDLSAMNEEALIKMYETTSEQFNTTFKPSGVTTPAAPEKPKAKITNIDTARMSSVGL